MPSPGGSPIWDLIQALDFIQVGCGSDVRLFSPIPSLSIPTAPRFHPAKPFPLVQPLPEPPWPCSIPPHPAWSLPAGQQPRASSCKSAPPGFCVLIPLHTGSTAAPHSSFFLQPDGCVKHCSSLRARFLSLSPSSSSLFVLCSAPPALRTICLSDLFDFSAAREGSPVGAALPPGDRLLGIPGLLQETQRHRVP